MLHLVTVPIALALLVYGIYSFIHLLIFIINILNFSGNEWFATDNFWSWVVVFFGVVIIGWIVRFVFRVVRYLIAFLGGLLGAAIAGEKHRDSGAVFGAYTTLTLTFITAFILAVIGVIATTNFTTLNPGLTDYFVEGNWFGYIFIFATFFGNLFPTKSET